MAWIPKPHIDKYGRKCYYVYERVSGQDKPICESAGHSMADALKIKNKLEKRRIESKRTNADYGATLWEICESYINLPKKRKRSARTVYIIDQSVRRIKEFFPKTKQIVDVTENDCENFINYLYGEKVGHNHTTVNITLRNFSAILNLAVRKRIIEINPLIGPDPREGLMAQEGEPEAKTIFLTAEEKARLFASAMSFKFRQGRQVNIDLVNIIKVLLNTGLRRNELLNLKKEDMIDDRHIIIQSRKQRHDEKRRSTKSRNPYTITINKEILHIFHSVKSGFIFPNWQNNRWILNQRFKKVADKAGLPELTPHGLRHTFASDALAKGIDIVVVSEMLNHSSIELTRKYYTHLAPGRLDDSFEKLATAQPALAIA